MRATKVGDMRIVANLGNDYQFISDSQDVQELKKHLGHIDDDNVNPNGYDAFFVKIEYGDYAEVWGMVGIVPRLSKLISRLL